MNKKKKDSLLNMRAVSRKLTGSSNKVRADFIPKKFRNTISECENCVERILNKSDLDKRQEKQKERMGI